MSLVAGIHTLDELELENQRVFLRTDLDAPLSRSGQITDETRLVAAVPTIKKLQELGALVIVGSRFGEHRGKLVGAPPSLEPAAARLSELCGSEVFLPDGCTGDSVKKVLTGLRPNQLCVLENLALEGDVGPQAEGFARQLQTFVDVYVCDAIRPLTTESATTTILPRLMEFKGVGPTMMRELQAISRIRSGIDRPRLLIFGGNSLNARLDLLDALAETADHVFLVGVAANTMLRAQGEAMGKSALEEDYLAGARTLADRLGKKLVLPTDFVVAESPRSTDVRTTGLAELGSNEMALDLGPESQARLDRLAQQAGTIVWCGTAGFHKIPQFSVGTEALCRSLATSPAFTMVTGDDSVAAATAVGGKWIPSIDCLTLGGEAALSLLKENKLPGLEALRGTTHE